MEHSVDFELEDAVNIQLDIDVKYVKYHKMNFHSSLKWIPTTLRRMDGTYNQYIMIKEHA